MKTRVIAYIRVSTEQQADSGLSLDAQRAKIKNYAEAMDLEVVELIEDAGFTAKTLDRPGLQRALSMLQEGCADGLLITKLDRLSRRASHILSMVDTYFTRDFALISIADQLDTRTPMGRLVVTIMAALAQWEAEEISERTKTALAEVKNRRGFMGPVPFGTHVLKRADGVYVTTPNETEQVAIGLILSMRAMNLGFEKIARHLNREGIASPGGSSWYATTVKRVVDRHAKAA